MFRDFSIRYKIAVIALVGIVGFVVFQTASYRLSVQIRDQLETILDEDFAILRFSNELQIHFSELDKLYQAALAEADLDTLYEADTAATQMKLRFETLRNNYNLTTPFYIEMSQHFIDYVDLTSEHTESVLTDSLNYEETLEGYARIGAVRDRYLALQQKFQEYQYDNFEKRLAQIEEEEEYLVQFGLMLGLLITSVLIMFSVLIIRRLILAFNNAVNVAEQIATGNLDQNIEIISKDETGQLLQSLRSMRDVLKTQHEESLSREKEQNFIAGLNETMRGDQKIEELTYSVLDYLSKELHSQIGAFYLFENDHLRMIASYAYSYDENAKVSYEIGESVVGQVAVEKRPQLIKDIPEGYFTIDSGLGKARPRSILFYPILFEGNLKGIIELAAFRTFSEEDIFFMERCHDAIAISINSAQARLKVASMLEQTQEQAEQLEQQREVLASINEKLESQNKTLDTQKNQILEKNTELEVSRKELVEKSEALEISGKYKSQFLSTMSHELRTPLNSILILSEALTQNRKHTLDDDDVQHAKVIHTAGADLLALINDILDLSKVEEGKMDIVIDEVNVHDLSRNIQDHFEYVAREKGLEFVVSAADDLGECFYTDRHRLRQILKNFISNAIKFTEKGGVYVDMAPVVEIDEQGAEQQMVRITVKDTGVGIEKSKQDLVFEAFKQADGTTSRKFGGTGLGLTISRELASLLGGYIDLDSEGLGKGSVFALTIPCGSADQISANEPEVSPAPKQVIPVDFSGQGGKRFLEGFRKDILFVNLTQSLYKRFDEKSQSLGLSTEFAASLQDAITLSKERLFEAVLIDCSLSKDVDWELLHQLTHSANMVFVAIDEAHKARIENIDFNYVGSSLSPDNLETVLQTIYNGLKIQKHKVLVVEDNPVFHEVIKTVFANEQLSATVVETGQEALDMLNDQHFGCLVVDLNLPDFDGEVLVEKIRAKRETSDVPIVVFTAEDLDLKRKRKILSVANKIVTKSPKAVMEICNDIKRLTPFGNKASALYPYAINSKRKVYQQGMLENVTVLIVDDDERNLYSVGAALGREGINVLTAKGGQEGLDLINEQSVDILLLDIMMPEMDGYEVLARLRNNAQTSALPVVAFTAKAMVGDKDKCLAAGANDYLSKPVEMQDLLNALVSNLNKKPDAAGL